MRVPRQGGWRRQSDTAGPSDAHQEAVRAARAEGDAVVRRERSQGRAAQAEDWQMRLKGGALESRRRLRPVGRGLRAFLGRIAPPISRGLLAVVRLPAIGVARLLEAATGAIDWTRPRLSSLASGFGALVLKWVTPVKTVAFVGLVAAVALGVSQFLDYRGVAVGADLYEGEVGTVAPAPLTDVEIAGSAHFYLLVPVALAALALTVLTARGRWELGRVLCGLGLLAVLVTLAIDLPQGLRSGTSGSAYASSDVELLDGFWIQLFSALVIALCGFLLARYVRDESEPPAAPAAGPRPWEQPVAPADKPEEPPGASPGGASPPPWEAGA